MPPVIEVTHLHKRYDDKVAVDDVSFTVDRGEIFGILGRNGAGKTTTVECVEGLRTPDRGTISVLGLDPRADRAELTRRLGVQLQAGMLPGRLRVGEALELYGSFYPRPADWRGLLHDLGLLREGPVRRPVGRPEAAAVHRAGPGRQPRRRDPRRAHHRARPAGAARHLGADRGGAGARGDDRAGHPLHGGGRTALRPDRPDRPGPGRRRDTSAGLTERAQVEQRIRFRPSREFDLALLAHLPEVSGVGGQGEFVVGHRRRRRAERRSWLCWRATRSWPNGSGWSRPALRTHSWNWTGRKDAE